MDGKRPRLDELGAADVNRRSWGVTLLCRASSHSMRLIPILSMTARAVTFDLPRLTDLKLALYDVRGRQKWRFVSGEMTPVSIASP